MQQQLSRLAKSMVIYGLGNGLNQLLFLLLLPLLTLYLTPKEFGTSSILTLIITMVTSVFSLGLGSAITPIYFEKKEVTHQANTIGTALLLLVISAIFLIILGFTFSKTISFLGFQTTEYQNLVTLSLLTAGFSILSTPLILYLQFEERVKLFVTLNLISSMVTIGLALLFVVLFRRGVLGWVESGLISRIIISALFFIPFITKYRFHFDINLAREMLKLGIPMIPSFAFVFVIQQADRFFLQYFHGLETLGVYSIGINIGLAMLLPVSAFTTAWTPFFMSFRNKIREGKQVFRKILTYYVFGFGSLSLLFFIFAKPVVFLITQPSFHDAYIVVGLIALAQTFNGVYSIFLPGMYYAKEIFSQVIIQFIASIVSIGAAFLFIPKFKTIGAALCLICGYFAMAGVTLIWNWFRRDKYINVKYEWPRIFVFIIVLVLNIIGSYYSAGLPQKESLIFSAFSLIILIMTIFKLMNKEERKILNLFYISTLKHFLPKN